jgi:hypothetical protein
MANAVSERGVHNYCSFLSEVYLQSAPRGSPMEGSGTRGLGLRCRFFQIGLKMWLAPALSTALQ